MIKFIDFKITPDEKHIGIATICLDDKIYLRYKVIPGKDGKGYFFKPASHKIDEEYVDAFLIDSRFTTEEIMKCLRDSVRDQNVMADILL